MLIQRMEVDWNDLRFSRNGGGGKSELSFFVLRLVMIGSFTSLIIYMIRALFVQHLSQSIRRQPYMRLEDNLAI